VDNDHQQTLRLLLSNGIPDPLADFPDGTCAIIDDDRTITVYDGVPDNWRLTAAASWPPEPRLSLCPWVALAPTDTGIVLLNLATTDIAPLPTPVQRSLEMQRNQHTVGVARAQAPRRVHLRDGQVHICSPSGPIRAIPVGAPYTASQEAFERQQAHTFGFLSPALRIVARMISLYGPITTSDLLYRVYPNPSNKDRSTLHVTLSRLRGNPRVDLRRTPDGRLDISLRDTPDGVSA